MSAWSPISAPVPSSRLQAIEGRTRMGFAEAGRRWVDNRFRSAFALLTRPFGPFGMAARAEAFDTRNRGSDVGDEYDETGWSAMLAGKREWGPIHRPCRAAPCVEPAREPRGRSGLRRASARRSSRPKLRMRW